MQKEENTMTDLPPIERVNRCEACGTITTLDLPSDSMRRCVTVRSMKERIESLRTGIITVAKDDNLIKDMQVLILLDEAFAGLDEDER